MPCVFVATEGSARSVEIAWIATNYCVRATAADAAQPGFAVRVLIDLTAGVGAGTTAKAGQQMRAKRSQPDRAGLAAASSRSLSVTCSARACASKARSVRCRWLSARAAPGAITGRYALVLRRLTASVGVARRLALSIRGR